jgi:C-terminal processing protease CtpA/Prc
MLTIDSDGFGLRILGGEEEKSQVSVGRIVAHSPAELDGRLQPGDHIIQIDGHSTIRATHDKVVQLMQQARENQRVSLLVRRQVHPNKSHSYASHESGVNMNNRQNIQETLPFNTETRCITLKKSNEHQSFGFVIISSQQRHGATVGELT